MAKKQKRVWTDEAKAAAKLRMEARWAAKRGETSTATIELPEPETRNMTDAAGVGGAEVQTEGVTAEFVRPPEVQAVIDSMDPQRKAKLAGMQARTWAHTLETETNAGGNVTREALERHDAEKAQAGGMTETAAAIARGAVFIPTETAKNEIPPSDILPMKVDIFKIPSHPFRFTSGANGMMISELGECLCGEKKLSWHPVCLKVKAHV